MRFLVRPGQTFLLYFCVVLLVIPLGVGAQPSSAPPAPLSDARPILPFITESLLQTYLVRLCQYGPRYAGTVSCTLAGEYIYNCFSAMGLPVEYHNWRFAGYKSRDVVATLPGRLPESQGVVIVCGHYDTIKVSPGADDDGSGAMAVVAIADALKGQTLDHTVRFITFSGEEVGTWGSLTYAREAAARGDNIIAVLNMDMVGYANTREGGRLMRFYPVERARWIADFTMEVSEKYRDVVDMGIFVLPNYRGSDHQAFLDYGYDAVWIDHNDGYAWGHSANDTPDHINWSYYVKAARFICAVTWELSMRSLPVQVVLTSPAEGTQFFFKHPVSHLSFARNWFSDRRGLTVIVGRGMARANVITDETIQWVIFCIDDNWEFWDTSPPFEWKIWGVYVPILGRHTLKVYAYTTAGHIASDEMDLFVLSFTISYRKHG